MSGLGTLVQDDRQANIPIVGRFPHYPPETAALGIPTGSPTEIAGTGNDDFLPGTDADDKITGKGGSDQIVGKAGNDLLIGGRGDDTLFGNRGNDSLRGGVGNDRLDGGLGTDDMIGHAGDDWYIVDDRGDSIVESQDGGHDIVGTYISLTIPLEVEEIIALQDAPIDLIGNGMDNFMIGNSNVNSISGAAGADTLVGGSGNDVLVGNAGSDLLLGSSGDDILSGGGGKDNLDGGTGDDLLNGGNARDILDGGTGNDSLYGDNGSDVLLGGPGNNILTGGKESDFFVVEFPGSQFDFVLDFETGETGDRIVVAEEVLDINLSDSMLQEYFQVASTNGWTTISIDLDGGGDSFIAVLQLNNLTGLPASSLVVADDGSLMINPAG